MTRTEAAMAMVLILAAFAVAGTADFEDAQRMEQAQYEAIHLRCQRSVRHESYGAPALDAPRPAPRLVSNQPQPQADYVVELRCTVIQ